MNLFLDTSVVISACVSDRGASREVCRLRGRRGWVLTITPYVAAEVEANLSGFGSSVAAAWTQLHPTLRVMPDVLTLNRPSVFGPPKDRPVLFAAVAWLDVLLTLDTGDFGPLMVGGFYGLPVTTPGAFLERQRPRDGTSPGSAAA